VVLEQFQFLGDNRSGAPGGGGATGSAESGIDQTVSPERQAPPARSAAPKAAAQENLDEDVPF
jgi:single-stranded DNA-binding protein